MKLFISYRSMDSSKVDKIALDLTLIKNADGTSKYNVWQDKHNLPPASPHWWDAIVDAIIDSDMVVFHISRESLKSDVCRAELEFAHARNMPIIPVVLDGEFFLMPDSGKYNIDYWDLVPDWLRDRQLFWYTGASFSTDFERAVQVFLDKPPRLINAPRPLNPDSKAQYHTNHALYEAACDYAERMALTDARKLFDELVRRNDADYADVAAEWLEILIKYEELAEIESRRAAQFMFKQKWTRYVALFQPPKAFIEGIFDPRGFATRGAPASSQPQVAQIVPQAASRPRAMDLLPAPFTWIEIPAGQVTLVPDAADKAESYLKDSTPFDVARFWIARYPVTNAQYAKFVESDGYSTQRWWTAEGWEAKTNGWSWDGSRQKWIETYKAWIEPRYWGVASLNEAHLPVVGVSWYEALAFCLWLSDQTGEAITLPTEQQWQRAAQGDDGRDYPWGKQWDQERCNNNVDSKGLGQTTPVQQYEGRNDSPFGVVDMAGNVWEWCLTAYQDGRHDQTGEDVRVLRGGSWRYDNPAFFRCDYRSGGTPHGGNNGWGFRIVVS